MQTIWKYELKPEGIVHMPANSQVLSVGAQGTQMFVWALVDSTLPANHVKQFAIYGTGHEVKASLDYDQEFIGTVLMMGGSLVFHVFEIIPVSSVH